MPPNEPGKSAIDEVTDTPDSTKASDPPEDSDQAQTRDEAEREGGRS
jgi:hypothetical protein